MTYDHAVRVYLWKQAGYEIPGISKKEIAIGYYYTGFISKEIKIVDFT